MKKLLFGFLFLLLQLSTVYEVYGDNNTEPQPLISWSLFPGAVEVIDNSTIKIVANGLAKEITLYGICSTKTKQQDKQAEELVRSLIDGKRTEIKIYGQNEQQKDLAVIFADGVNINKEIVIKGYALTGKQCKSAFVSEQKKQNPQTVSPGHYSLKQKYSNPSYDNSSQSSSYHYRPFNSGRPKTVHVRSYTKKDGTHVRSHYRSAPRR